ncbi:MAG: S41 family peptidase [Pseudomonadota bacterium]
MFGNLLSGRRAVLVSLTSLCFLAVDALAAPAAANPAGRVVSGAAALEDVALMREAFERIHPGYERYTDRTELDAAWDRLRDVVADGTTVGDFYIETQRTLTTIRCDHTKAELPNDLAKDRNAIPVYLPFKWLLVERRGFVTGAPEGSPFNRFDEILAIDARPLSEIVDDVAPLIPVDGYTEWARRTGISQSNEFRGGAVDHFGALMFDIEPTVSVTVRTKDGTEKTHSVSRVTYDDYQDIQQPRQPARNFKDAVTFERIGESAAYLRVDTFVNYRDVVDPDDLYDPVFDALKREGRDTLILDLRVNGGGSNDASQGLTRRLITEPTRLVLEARVATIDHSGLEDHISTWDKKALNPPRIAFRKNDDGTYSLRRAFDEGLRVSKPTRNAFDGKLIILTSTDNSSGSTNLISVLKGLGRATLIGERTGGAPNGATAGVIFTLTAPNSGVRTRIPVFRYVNNVQGIPDGYGLEPDIATPLTVDAFLDGRDPAYDAALALIGE